MNKRTFTVNARAGAVLLAVVFGSARRVAVSLGRPDPFGAVQRPPLALELVGDVHVPLEVVLGPVRAAVVLLGFL